MKAQIVIERAGKGRVIVRIPPLGLYLIDGKTGAPAEFNESDVRSINYDGRNTELYRVLRSITTMEGL